MRLGVREGKRSLLSCAAQASSIGGQSPQWGQWTHHRPLLNFSFSLVWPLLSAQEPDGLVFTSGWSRVWLGSYSEAQEQSGREPDTSRRGSALGDRHFARVTKAAKTSCPIHFLNSQDSLAPQENWGPASIHTYPYSAFSVRPQSISSRRSTWAFQPQDAASPQRTLWCPDQPAQQRSCPGGLGACLAQPWRVSSPPGAGKLLLCFGPGTPDLCQPE